MVDKQVYPRLPERNWWIIRNQFKKTLPSAVTTSYLKSLLNLTSEKAARNLLPPLRQIGLIDEEGKPTARANEWRSDSKYSETCKSIVEEIYPQEMRDLFAGPELDRKPIKEWLMHTASIGEGAADLSAAMYILLNEATLKDDEELSKIVNGSTKKVSKDKSNKPSTKNIESEIKPDNIELMESTQQASISQSESDSFSTALHIDLQIHISADASADQIESIFANIAKYLYKK